jgi:nucleoside-diphosphate-sugar epimerase
VSLVLIAGGAGFLGSAVVRGLLRAGDRAVLLDSFDDGGDGRALKEERVAAFSGDARVTVVRADATDPLVLDRVLAGHRPAAVVNVTALAPSGRGVGPLLEASRTSGIGVFVHVSDGRLYGPRDEERRRAREDEPSEPGDDPLLKMKADEEEALLASGLPFVILRVFEAVGPGGGPARFPLDALEALLAGEEVRLTDDAPRDFVHVDDVARGILLALARRPFGEVVNLGFGRAVLPSDLVRAIATRVTRDARIVVSGDSPRPPRIADLDRAWERLGYSPTLGVPEVVWDVTRARLFPEEAADRAPLVDSATRKDVKAPPVSRRELFGLFRKPFDDAAKRRRG